MFSTDEEIRAVPGELVRSPNGRPSTCYRPQNRTVEETGISELLRALPDNR
jgi:hypothetical protein